MKQSGSIKPRIRVRKAEPIIQNDGGKPAIMCPFCQPSHPISLAEIALCGTRLQLEAVQEILPGWYAQNHKIACLKCHKVDGQDLVPFQGGFIHLRDCMPGTKFLAVPPKFTHRAKFVFGLPSFLRPHVEKFTGVAKEVKEIDRNGHETGVILGYSFYRG